jgi:hypothetical protein
MQTGGPQTTERWEEFGVAHNRHGLQRIFEMRSATTANFVGVTVEGEDATQLRVVTAEGKL